MKDRIKVQVFSFDQQYKPYQKEEFAKSFFQDPTVLTHLQVISNNGRWGPLGVKAESVDIEPIQCSVLSMSFFDRLETAKIVRESGMIQKCFDEYFENFVISDELRKCLLIDDSDNYSLFSDADRDEFLFRLFQHICLGGEVCQYEDKAEAYLTMTKTLYKELLSVQKDSGNGELVITSNIMKVSAKDASGETFYPSDRDHLQDFAYLVIDPLKRHVAVLYHKFGCSSFT